MLESALAVALVIAGIAIVAILVMSYGVFFRSSLMDTSEDDPWTEPVFNALIIVAALAFLSWFNLRLIGTPIALEMNVTGAIVPIVVSSYLLVNVRAGWRNYAVAIGAVALLGLLTTSMTTEGVFVPISSWVLVVAVCAALSYVLSRGNLTHAIGLAYVSATMGMLFGGDILQLARLEEYIGPFIIGIGGIMDFVFLTGVMAVAFILAAHYIGGYVVGHISARQRT